MYLYMYVYVIILIYICRYRYRYGKCARDYNKHRDYTYIGINNIHYIFNIYDCNLDINM